MWSPRQEFGPRGATETPACRRDVALLYVESSSEQLLRTKFRRVTVNGQFRKKLRARLPMWPRNPGGCRCVRTMGLTTAGASQRVDFLDAKPIANVVHLVGNVLDQK